MLLLEDEVYYDYVRVQGLINANNLEDSTSTYKHLWKREGSYLTQWQGRDYIKVPLLMKPDQIHEVPCNKISCPFYERDTDACDAECEDCSSNEEFLDLCEEELQKREGK